MILSDAEVAVLTGRQRSDAQKRQLRHMPALQLSECRFPLCRRALRCYAPPIQSGGTVAGNRGGYGNGCGSFGVRKRREIAMSEGDIGRLPKPLCWVHINKQGDVTHHGNRDMPWSRTPVYTAQQMREYAAAEREKLLMLLRECRCYITGDVGWDYDTNRWLPDRIDEAIAAGATPDQEF